MRKPLILFLLICFFIPNISAFEDSVQRYPNGLLTDVWHPEIVYSGSGASTISIVQEPPAILSSNTISMYGANPLSGQISSTSITSYDLCGYDYFSFVNRKVSYIAIPTEAYIFWIYEDAGSASSINLKQYIIDYDNNDLFEFIKIGNSFQLYINGMANGSSFVAPSEPAYIKIYLGGSSSSYSVGHRVYFDDFTDTGNIIGTNLEWTEGSTFIETSYSVRSMFSFPSAVYEMKLKNVGSGAVINTTTLPSNQALGDKPCGFIQYNRNDVLGTNYGLYHLTLNRDGSKIGETNFWYRYSSSLGTISWSENAYSIGQDGTISYSLITPDYGAYDYKIETMGISGTIHDSWSITDSFGSKTVDLSDYPTGTIYAIFKRIDKSSGEIIEFEYDFTTLTETVVIQGKTLNGITNESMNDILINFSQTSTWYNGSSDTTGDYNLSELSTNIQIDCNASVTYLNHSQIINETFNSSECDIYIPLNNDMITNGSVNVTNITDNLQFLETGNYTMNYTDGKIMVLSTGSMITYTDYHIDYNTTESFIINPFNFTPLSAQVYFINLYLFNANHTYNNTSIYGLVGDTNYYQPINNGTVTIWNATWCNTTQTTSTGYYVFHNLTNNTLYNVNASANSYITSSNYEITPIGNTTRKDIQLKQLYTVTIKAKCALSTAYITSYTSYFDDKQNTSSSGITQFYNVEYGTYSISVSADGYYPEATTKLIDKDTTIILSLTKTDSDYYAPHYVKFTLLNIFGKKYPNVPTTVYKAGVNHLSGNTGTDGSITFKLTENIEYKLTFINVSQEIDISTTLFPKDSEYYIYTNSFSFSPDDNSFTDNIDWNWSPKRINITHGWINFTYHDYTNKTTFIEYWINSSNNTNLYYFNNTTSACEWSINQTVDANNKSYMLHFSGTHPDYPSLQNSARHTVSFFGLQISFGWSEAWHYSTLAICVLIFIGLLFGGTNAHIGALLCVFVGWFFVWIGWFVSNPATYIMMVLATVVAIGINMRKGESLQ